MECKTHAGEIAVNRCAGCAEPFCAKCLVTVSGQTYCSSCKVLNVKKMPMAVEITKPCQEASDAFKFAAIGIFLGAFMGIIGGILVVMAIGKGITARGLIRANPQLTGAGKANAAILIGLFNAIFVVLVLAKSH